MPDLTLEKLEECFSEMMLYLKNPALEEEESKRGWCEYAAMNVEERVAWWENIKLKDYCQKRLDFYWSRKLGRTNISEAA